MARLRTVLALVIALSGCGDSVVGVARTEIERLHVRWMARGIVDYDMDVDYLNAWGAWGVHRIEVRGGAVTRCARLVEGHEVEPLSPYYCATVDDLFTRAAELDANPAWEIKVEVFDGVRAIRSIEGDLPRGADGYFRWDVETFIER